MPSSGTIRVQSASLAEKESKSHSIIFIIRLPDSAAGMEEGAIAMLSSGGSNPGSPVKRRIETASVFPVVKRPVTPPCAGDRDLPSPSGESGTSESGQPGGLHALSEAAMKHDCK